MTERGPLYDQNDTPEDVASLYSWANLHGAKYRDFSASRAQTREKARLRVQQASEEEQGVTQRELEQDFAAEERRAAMTRIAEAAMAEEAARQAELTAEQLRQHEATLQAAHEAAQRAAHLAAHLAAERAAEEAARQSAVQAAQQAAQQAEELAAQKAARQAEAAKQAAWQQSVRDRFTAFTSGHPAPATAPFAPSVAPEPPVASQAVPADLPPFEYPSYVPLSTERPVASPAQSAPMREESYPQARIPAAPSEGREIPPRPAWLTPDRAEPVAAPQQAPEDTLQGSRDRLASRWYALRGVFEAAGAPVETAPVPPPARAPVVAVFSLAGGVGKTSLVATLGRALSARGERVLLVDTAPFGLLPFFFGARDQRPGLLRTFTPPGASGDAPIQMITIDPESLGAESAGQEPLSAEIGTHARGVSRVIVDLATASGATTRRIVRMAPLVLVPMVPDMNSVVSVSSIDSFFQHNGTSPSKPTLPYYVLNQFDPSQPLHLDIREVLREQLGERLLPFVVRRAPSVSEALAEGMTV
ncbi:MAG TPA: cellulose synthase operon protein YhjQ/BcsQ, partial [Terracidiphilus sp.]|nr:cellulose synthase operon protein YhjQ/BcsQ [Terracidiphilus sp.]